MAILLIAGVILAIALVIWCLYIYATKLNNYTENKYNYTPIEPWTQVPICISYIFLLIAVIFFANDITNLWAATGLIVISTIGVGIRIMTKSSLVVALLSVPILNFLAVPFIIKGIFEILIVVGEAQNTRYFK